MAAPCRAGAHGRPDGGAHRGTDLRAHDCTSRERPDRSDKDPIGLADLNRPGYAESARAEFQAECERLITGLIPPTQEPTAAPTDEPTATPTAAPTEEPTPSPTIYKMPLAPNETPVSM
jgi:hypothetical protein